MRYIYLSLLLALAACGGGGETTPPPQTEVLPPAPSLYTTAPNISTCSAGALKSAEKQRALDAFNAIRDMHGLPPVVYDNAADAEMAAAALIMAANKTTNHAPGVSALCYSASGFSGAQNSNLFFSSTVGDTQNIDSSFPIRAFVQDSGVSNLRDRRRLLDPFLGSTAFARVDGTSGTSNVMGAALKVIGGTPADLSLSTVNHVAFPEGNYPSLLVDKSWFLSFSVLADKMVKANNNGSYVDFSASTIEVTNSAMALMPVTAISFNYDNYGLPNHLQWKVSGLQDNMAYMVKVNNVVVNGAAQNFSYSFTLTP